MQSLQSRPVHRRDILVPIASVNMSAENLRLLLVGKTGAGKSATGNTIIEAAQENKNKFQVSGRGFSQTQTCQAATVSKFGRELTVIDTPGFFDTDRNALDVDNATSSFLTLSSPGPHAILLVLAATRFTEEQVDVVIKLKDLFGDDVMKFLILVFTKTENWKMEDITLQEFLQSLPETYRLLIPSDVLERRSVAFVNGGAAARDEGQVRTLIAKVDDVIRENRGGVYTRSMWDSSPAAERRRERERAEAEIRALEFMLEMQELESLLLRLYTPPPPRRHVVREVEYRCSVQ